MSSLEEIRNILKKDNSGEILDDIRKEILEKNKIERPEFERLKNYDKALIPTRGTLGSGGYDFRSFRTLSLPPKETTYVPTGIKAKMPYDVVLLLFIRSSMAKDFSLSNGVGVVDSDYYNNNKNEGHIMGMVYNKTNEVLSIQEGQRFMQGIFLPYITVSNDIVKNIERTGGFGSTGM